MPELIKQRFLYGTNSDIASLWASMGYIYGKCARQLHYTNKFGYNGFTEKDLANMESGTQIHKTVESYMKIQWPDIAFEDEVKHTFMINLPDNTPMLIGAKCDLIAMWHPNLKDEYDKTIIEIKYLYSRMGYYQTLIEKLVNPKMKVMCFQYGNLTKPQFKGNILIPIKADLEMAKVYAGRIITSLYELPPRFPNAHYSHPTCSKCIHRDICYNGTFETDDKKSETKFHTSNDNTISDLDAWNTFKTQSQKYIECVQKVFAK